jgi:hypothetical protein
MDIEKEKDNFNKELQKTLKEKYGNNGYYRFTKDNYKEIVNENLATHTEMSYDHKKLYHYDGRTPAHKWTLSIRADKSIGTTVEFLYWKRGMRLFAFILFLLLIAFSSYIVFSGIANPILNKISRSGILYELKITVIIIFSIILYIPLNRILNVRIFNKLFLQNKEKKLKHQINDIKEIIITTIKKVFKTYKNGFKIEHEDANSFTYIVGPFY